VLWWRRDGTIEAASDLCYKVPVQLFWQWVNLNDRATSVESLMPIAAVRFKGIL
jgi:hypothetical protein